MVSFVLVVPSLFLIHSYYGTEADSFMTLPLIMFILCNYAFYYGFNKAQEKAGGNQTFETFDLSRVKIVVLIFAVVGLYATLKNRGAYQGGFVEGVYVILSFFTSYFIISMNVVFTCIFKRYKIPFYFYFIIVIALYLQIEQFVSIARRAQAMQTLLTCAFFYFLMHDVAKYKRFKWVVPFVFIVGFFLNSQVSLYRSNAYSKEMTIWENVNSIDFFNKETSTFVDFYGNEVHNAMIGINDISSNLSFDYGLFNWNEIVHDFVPKVIVGSDIKAALMVDFGGSKQAEKLQSSGATMTGYYDAFSSFGYFGWVKFLLIGYLMGYFWRKRETSVNYLLLYVCLFSPVMEIISHGSHYPISRLVFYYAFAYPFIKMTFCKKRIV